MSGPTSSVFVKGLLCCCPRCGAGKLFTGYLKLAPTCAHCGLDFGFADSGDGPAVFVIFLVAPLIMVFWYITEALLHLAPWMHLVLWIQATLILSLLTLPPFKGVLVALQYQNSAGEGRFK